MYEAKIVDEIWKALNHLPIFLHREEPAGALLFFLGFPKNLSTKKLTVSNGL